MKLFAKQEPAAAAVGPGALLPSSSDDDSDDELILNRRVFKFKVPARSATAGPGRAKSTSINMAIGKHETAVAKVKRELERKAQTAAGTFKHGKSSAANYKGNAEAAINAKAAKAKAAALEFHEATAMHPNSADKYHSALIQIERERKADLAELLTLPSGNQKMTAESTASAESGRESKRQKREERRGASEREVQSNADRHGGPKGASCLCPARIGIPVSCRKRQLADRGAICVCPRRECGNYTAPLPGD